jgi:hypothetical protein
MTEPEKSTDQNGEATASAEVPPANDAESSAKPVTEGGVGPERWSIYDAVPDDWTEFRESLGRWKQGDLVADVPPTWLTGPGEDVITGASNDRPEILPLIDPDVRVTAVICTQTCDLGGTPPGSAQPFVLLAPLVHESCIPTRADRTLARQGKIGHLVRTHSPAGEKVVATDDTQAAETIADQIAEAEEFWYADLRLIFPASKALLLDRDPAQGFDGEADSLAFGEILAQKFRRAALNEVLSEDLPKELRKFVKDNGHRKPCFASVEQVRLITHEGTRLLPARATLLVLTDGLALTDDERAVWTRFQKGAERLFTRHNIRLGPMLHADVNKLSAARYRESVPVRCDLLGSVNWP